VINILIVEDDRDVRLSLKNILTIDPEFCVIGEAENGLEAVGLARNLLPDLILMDIRLPELDGLEATKRIKAFCEAENKDIKILVLSTFFDDDLVLKAQEYGVDGYLLKGLSSVKLVSAIKNTFNGLVTLDRIIYEKQNRQAINGVSKKSELSVLTNTELNILKLIVNGKNNAEIAAELFLSEGTVKNNVSNMLSKLGCRNSRALAVFGLKAGL